MLSVSVKIMHEKDNGRSSKGFVESVAEYLDQILTDPWCHDNDKFYLHFWQLLHTVLATTFHQNMFLTSQKWKEFILEWRWSRFLNGFKAAPILFANNDG